MIFTTGPKLLVIRLHFHQVLQAKTDPVCSALSVIKTIIFGGFYTLTPVASESSPYFCACEYGDIYICMHVVYMYTHMYECDFMFVCACVIQ